MVVFRRDVAWLFVELFGARAVSATSSEGFLASAVLRRLTKLPLI